MRPLFPQRKFSRRDILKALSGRLRQDGTAASPTGFDPSSKAIDQLIQHGRVHEAIPKLRDLLAKSPDHVQAQRKLGYCLLQTGDEAEAQTIFTDLLQAHPSDPFALLHQGLALSKQGHLEQAVHLWRQYFNTDQPIIQRAGNLQIALFDSGGPSTPQEAAASIAEAIARQMQQEYSAD